jgi:hypothetical protein
METEDGLLAVGGERPPRQRRQQLDRLGVLAASREHARVRDDADLAKLVVRRIQPGRRVLIENLEALEVSARGAHRRQRAQDVGVECQQLDQQRPSQAFGLVPVAALRRQSHSRGLDGLQPHAVSARASELETSVLMFL